MAVVSLWRVVWRLVVESLGGNFKQNDGTKLGGSLLRGQGQHFYRPWLQGHLLEPRGPYGHGKALARVRKTASQNKLVFNCHCQPQGGPDKCWQLSFVGRRWVLDDESWTLVGGIRLIASDFTCVYLLENLVNLLHFILFLSLGCGNGKVRSCWSSAIKGGKEVWCWHQGGAGYPISGKLNAEERPDQGRASGQDSCFSLGLQ